MDVGTIMYVTAEIMTMFSPALGVLFGVVIAAVGLRWIIKVFMR